MKITRFNVLFLVLICVLFCSIDADAQRRRGSRARGRTARPAPTAATAAGVQAGASLVAEQIKTLTRFAYAYGGITKSLEETTRLAETNSDREALLRQKQQGTEAVALTLGTLRQELDKLENQFLTQPALKPFLPRVSGVALLTENAEENVRAGRFAAAGRQILEVVNRLTDALATIR